MRIQDFRGEIIKDAPIGKESWFGCGGYADLLFKPADIDDLSEFLKQWPLKEPLTIIGGLANTIVRDGGVRGATIRLDKNFADIHNLDNQYISAGCGANNANIAASAARAGIGGLEFMSGIPGTLGGALRMNAGAYGSEMKDVLVGVTALDRGGQTLRLTKDDLKMSYRHTGISEDILFTGAVLKGRAENYELVKARMNEIKQKRNDTQPIRELTGGSTFANPDAEELRKAGLPEGTRAWQVIEKVGGRNFSIGGAQMSEKHCNFMINTGTASARDLEALGEELRARALKTFGLNLHWEIHRIGEI